MKYCYKINECQKVVKWKDARHKKPHGQWFCLYEVPNP